MDVKVSTEISIIKRNVPLKQSPFIREALLRADEFIATLPGAQSRFDLHSESCKKADEMLPLTHTFGDGLYVREIFMPKNHLLTTRIHKTTHPYFILKGDVSVLTEEGPIRIKAPHHGITKAGTKRLLFIHEDTVWITVHATKETDVIKIEEEITAIDYDDLPNNIIETLGEVTKEELCFSKE